jgi:uncharacterized protein (DUF1778 family)
MAAERKRTVPVNIRLTEDEREMLQQVAEEAGLSVSDTFRQLVRKAFAKLPPIASTKKTKS